MLIVGGGNHEIAVAENRSVNCPCSSGFGGSLRPEGRPRTRAAEEFHRSGPVWGGHLY